jgi:hypothetical protein
MTVMLMDLQMASCLVIEKSDVMEVRMVLSYFLLMFFLLLSYLTLCLPMVFWFRLLLHRCACDDDILNINASYDDTMVSLPFLFDSFVFDDDR